MKKPIEHKCMDCGNVYYYRWLKLKKRCPVCGGDLMPKGYRYASWFGGRIVKMPFVPPPPPMPKKCEAPGAALERKGTHG